MLSVRQLTPTETYAVRRRSLSLSSSPPTTAAEGRMIQSIIECRSPASRPTIRLPGQEVPGWTWIGQLGSLPPAFCAALSVYERSGARCHCRCGAPTVRCVRTSGGGAQLALLAHSTNKNRLLPTTSTGTRRK